MQESNDQRAEQKRRVSELVNLSEIVPCAKGQMSMQNNQLSHTRWDHARYNSNVQRKCGKLSGRTPWGITTISI